MSELKQGATYSVGGFMPSTWPTGTWTATAELVDASGVRQDIDATLTPPVAPETRLHLGIYIGAAQSAELKLGRYAVVVKLTDSAATPEPFVDFTSYPLTVVSNAKGCA